jgi:hypothetical protein
VAGSGVRESRLALVVTALALLAGLPGVLAAAGVRNPWALGGATAVAGVVVAFGAVWQERYKRLAQRRDEQAFRIEDGCLVLPGGRLPRVRDIADPVLLGVHNAAPVTVPAGGEEASPPAGEHVPAYVPRDVDGGLRERLAAGGFVLLVGVRGDDRHSLGSPAHPPSQPGCGRGRGHSRGAGTAMRAMA